MAYADFPSKRKPAYGFASLGATVECDDETHCNFFDIPHCTEPSPGCRISEGALDDTSFVGWIGSPLSHKGGLRLLLGVCGFNTEKGCPKLPLSSTAFSTLEAHLCLPEEFATSFSGTTARTFKLSLPKRDKPSANGFNPKTIYIFRFGVFRPSYYHLVLSHDASTNLTHGLLLSKTNDHEISTLIEALKRKSGKCKHPLLLAVLIVETVNNSISARIQTANYRLNELEETMGQHEYINRPMGNPLELDFLSTTRRLNFIARTLAGEGMRIGATLLILDKISRETRELARAAEIDGTVLSSGTSVSDTSMIDEMVAHHVDACQNLALRAQYEEKRTQTQLGVVYQFMTQKDSKVNISLAETSATIAQESKKDSSAMKTIAVLTMCFLPATFLAALFAMPFFNWDNKDIPVIKDGFKYYWAIAIPLTGLVLLIWALAMSVSWRGWIARLRPKVEDIEAGKVARPKDE